MRTVDHPAGLLERVPDPQLDAVDVEESGPRLERASDAREEGRRICIELIRAVREIPGVAGIHLMAHRQERLVRSIVVESGVLAGRAAMFDAVKEQAYA